MLTAEGLSCFPRQMWDKVLSKVKNAVIFIDDRCAESLHWVGGATVFLDAGARNLKQFSSFEAGGENEPKAVFVVSTLLKGRTADIIKDIISLSHFQYCIVFTAVAHSIHLLANNVSTELEGSPVFEQFEEKLCEWMGDMNFTAEVMYVPLSFAPVSPQLLLAPAFGDLFPLHYGDLESINRNRPEKKKFGHLSEVDVHSLSPDLQIEIKSLVSALNSMFEFTNTREECFAVGPLSRIIAGELANYPQAKNRRKIAPNKASIVFIDRNLDLAGAVGHHGDSLVEKILSTLQPLTGHRNDIQVDMVELTGLPATPENRSMVAPGCLAQPQDSAVRALWDAMLTWKQKEAVMEVRRHLVEAASKEKLPIKMSLGRVTAEQLSSYVQLFKSSQEALDRHWGLLQLALATTQTLRHPTLARWDACLAFERLLLQALGDSDRTAVLKQVSSLADPAATETQDRFSLEELLVLLVYVYALGQGAEQKGKKGAEQQVEHELIGVLTLALSREKELSPLLQKLTGCPPTAPLTTQKARIAMERVFGVLRDLGHARDHLKQLRSIYQGGDGVHQATYRPFLKQVLDDIYHPDRPDCVDIEHMSSGLTDLLKTGFSMFLKVSRPHPGDHALLVLFVVGGVTPSELRLVREAISAHKPGAQVLILSTRLLRASDILELLFTTDHLHPDIGV
ncbi:sec1 family domain-containing protein 2 [Brienomyrus brachyistius]|uniref:sec1 family domain-containing protein 2 n=1 Tax=Brienomyrus brachyistius TaxID=42636 RepID=UPI0020B319AC|nr:sec1 family domain-containing protein 2 [Brienomyrus brachyistius]